jgi:hypothetical protein
MKINLLRQVIVAISYITFFLLVPHGSGQTNSVDYQIFVSNEKSDDLTIISGGDFKVGEMG